MTITQAEMGELLFRTDKVKDKTTNYFMNEPPKFLVMATEMLTNTLSLVRVDDRGLIIISAANGQAVYKLCQTQIYNYGLTLERVTHAYSEPPPPPPNTIVSNQMQ